MYKAKAHRFNSVHGWLIALHGKPDLSRCYWRVFRVPFVFQLYLPQTLCPRSLDTRLVDDFMKERREHGRKTRSCRLKLFDPFDSRKVSSSSVYERLLPGKTADGYEK